jgi:hypothetical protein
MKSRTYLKRKEVDDVLGGDDSWGNQTACEFSFPYLTAFYYGTYDTKPLVPNASIQWLISWNYKSDPQMSQ